MTVQSCVHNKVFWLYLALQAQLTLGSCHVPCRPATSALGWCCPPGSSGRCPPSCPRCPRPTRSRGRPCRGRGGRWPGVEAPGVACSAPPDSLETHSLLSSHVTQIPLLLLLLLLHLLPVPSPVVAPWCPPSPPSPLPPASCCPAR